MLADFVVLSKDITRIETSEILKVKVLRTIRKMNSKQVAENVIRAQYNDGTITGFIYWKAWRDGTKEYEGHVAAIAELLDHTDDAKPFNDDPISIQCHIYQASESLA